MTINILELVNKINYYLMNLIFFKKTITKNILKNIDTKINLLTEIKKL